jgi:hypothetical protein
VNATTETSLLVKNATVLIYRNTSTGTGTAGTLIASGVTCYATFPGARTLKRGDDMPVEGFDTPEMFYLRFDYGTDVREADIIAGWLPPGQRIFNQTADPVQLRVTQVRVWDQAVPNVEVLAVITNT